ncbi:MAG: TonB-dependent receptor [Bacteroidales bacterium]|nr:TonB-dependent receptor [Bacteroidales bacterium]
MQKLFRRSKWVISVASVIMAFLLQNNLYGSFPNDALAEQGSVTITGTVTDAITGDPLPGVSIIITGTNSGTITDVDGKYSIDATVGQALSFSFVGYLTEEKTIGNETVINMSLTEDVIGLDEIVVIGYGVQKKKLTTGANLNVSGEDIEALNTTSSMDALKGMSPGVTISQNNGQPGAGNKIYIRGIGTTGNFNPLYIVDGVAVGDIDNLSPSDIESIDILKDAASAAIYGSRAANGVILVTTKKGRREMPTKVSYNGYFGVQNYLKRPDVLSASEYAAAANEANINAGFDSINFTNVPYWDEIVAGTYDGTNWVDEMSVENAPVQSHALNVTGGSDKSVYSMGASYLSQTGIVGKGMNNTYNRINLRLNSEHVLAQIAGRDFLTFGENLTFTNEKNPTIRTGNIYWNDFHSALGASPFLPMYAEDTDDPAYPYHNAISWNTQESNPYAEMALQSQYNTNSNNTITGNAYLLIQPVKGLSIRSALGINNWYGNSRQWIPAYSYSDVSSNSNDQVNQSMYQGLTWTSTNTITYSFNLNKLHNFTFLAGQEAIRNSMSLSMNGHNEGSIFNDPEYGYLDNFPVLDGSNATLANFGGKDDYGWAMMSYFGRISYDYRETYMLTAVLRADGSSKFDRGNRWGTFPSVSAGWVLSNESFMQDISEVINFAKLRASWGQNGNQDIADYQYLATITLEGVNYYFGPDHSISTMGSTPAWVPNPNVTWETSEQTDVGIDLNFLRNKVQFSLDWYQKDTKDWLVTPPSSVMDGADPAPVNSGLVRNKGIETFVRYNDNIGDLKVGISATFAYNKNLMVELPSSDSIIHGASNVLSQGVAEMYRCEVGYPIGFFWGYETDGVVQNQAEADEYNVQGSSYQDSLFFNPNSFGPGNLRFVDQNGDGTINDDDKVMIGNPHPDFIFGLTLNLEYKGAFLQVSGNGMAGHQIAKNYRSVDSYRANYTQEVVDQAWRGEGTSERYPMLYRGASRDYQWVNDTYIYNGDFFRISNLTIGYDFKDLLEWLPFDEFRVYATARNLYVFTNYPGLDPEIGSSPTDDGWAAGIDVGLYPQSRTFMGGLNVTF